MALVIKKPIDLSVLGDEYQGVNLVFKSIPAIDLGGLNKKQEALSTNGKDPDLDKILPFFIETLQSYFVEGKQGEEAVVKEDLNQLDSEALVYCFQVLMGQAPDPKVSSESTSSSTMELEEAKK